jgi:PucR C-terminal helix-turn-helix domain/GGDEF-like domain
MSRVQELIDELGTELAVPVTLEDPTYRLIAHGGPTSPIDDVRLASVLGRRATAAVVGHFDGFGIRGWTSGGRIDGDESAGTLARWCIPIRHRGGLIAFLWLLIGDSQLSNEQLERAAAGASRIGLLLDSERFTQELSSELLRQLLTAPDGGEVASIERELHASGAWLPRQRAVVITVARLDGIDSMSEVDEALVEVSHTLASGGWLRLTRPDEGILVAAVARSGDLGEAQTAAARLVERVRRHTHFDAIAGIGSVVDGLPQIRASLRQAHLSLRIARALPRLGPVATWSSLGVFRALALVPANEIVPLALDERVLRLIDHGDEQLIETAETYLDLAGDAQATAAALHIHRATLYHRLDRLRTVTDLDLRSGDDRLVLHLGLKLARLR